MGYLLPVSRRYIDIPTITIRQALEIKERQGEITIAPEIPRNLFDEDVPSQGYYLALFPCSPEGIWDRNVIRDLTMAEVWYAIAFMNGKLMAAIDNEDVRFMHHPFSLQWARPMPADPGMQIVTRRKGQLFAVETVSASASHQGTQLAYAA